MRIVFKSVFQAIFLRSQMRRIHGFFLFLLLFLILFSFTKGNNGNYYSQFDLGTCSDFISIQFETQNYQYLSNNNDREEYVLNVSTDKCLQQNTSLFLTGCISSIADQQKKNWLATFSSNKYDKYLLSLDNIRAPPVNS